MVKGASRRLGFPQHRLTRPLLTSDGTAPIRKAGAVTRLRGPLAVGVGPVLAAFVTGVLD